MNNPEYILTDEMQLVIDAVKAALNVPAGTFPVLNYQYGYVQELNETLLQWEKDPTKSPLKFPLVWLAEPYEINRGMKANYGDASVDIFIINKSAKTWKAAERMDNNFKPVIYPIYRQMLEQFVISPAFNVISLSQLPHKYTNRYYFGENNKTVLNDVVDCMRISFQKLPLSEKTNCTIFSNI